MVFDENDEILVPFRKKSKNKISDGRSGTFCIYGIFAGKPGISCVSTAFTADRSGNRFGRQYDYNKKTFECIRNRKYLKYRMENKDA